MALIKCKHCGAKIRDGAEVCPGCGAPVNGAASYIKMIPLYLAGIAYLVIVAVLLCGRPGVQNTAPDAATTVPTTIPEETIPGPTTPPDGNPGDVTCQGTYTDADHVVLAASGTVAATMGEEQLTNGRLQVYYLAEIQNFLARNDASALGLDLTQPLDTQLCSLREEGVTWQQYFLQRALEAWQIHQAIVQESIANEFTLTQSYSEYLETLPSELEQLALDHGYADAASLVTALVGTGPSVEDYLYYIRLYNQSYAYFSHIYGQTEPTSEDVAAHYTENADRYAENGIARDSYCVDIRHILLIPQGGTENEDGTTTYTAEEMDACLASAQAMLYQWKRTKGANEHSFALLANENSADSCSNTNGGKYTSLQKGQLAAPLDAWCFDETRRVGDTEVIQTEQGCHILYFSGSWELWYIAAEQELKAEAAAAMVRAALEAHPMEVDYSSIRLNSRGCDITEDAAAILDSLCCAYPRVGYETYTTPPQFFQQDYAHVRYGGWSGTVATHGCGITTLAMLASYMTDTELTPEEMAKQFWSYSSSQGTSFSLFEDGPRDLGFYVENRTMYWSEAQPALENGQMVVCLQFAGPFTTTAHFLLLTEMTEDGKVMIMDANRANHTNRYAGTDYYENGFNPEMLTWADHLYWIYEKKITHVDTCAVCGDPEAEGFPAGMFAGDYLCDKCRSQSHMRSAFADIFLN